MVSLTVASRWLGFWALHGMSVREVMDLPDKKA